VWHDSFICVTWLIHTCDMTHSYVWHDSSICVTWLIHMCDVTPSQVWHDSFVCVAWCGHDCLCDMTHSHVWCDLFTCVTFIFVTWLLHMRDITHSYVWRDLFRRVTCQNGNTRKEIHHANSRWNVWKLSTHNQERYSWLQIGWPKILRLFLKLFQRSKILPIRFTMRANW